MVTKGQVPDLAVVHQMGNSNKYKCIHARYPTSIQLVLVIHVANVKDGKATFAENEELQNDGFIPGTLVSLVRRVTVEFGKTEAFDGHRKDIQKGTKTTVIGHKDNQVVVTCHDQR
jgi:hypothetical protein